MPPRQCDRRLGPGTSRRRCTNEAVFALYSAIEGQRTMRCVAVFCGLHKPKVKRGAPMRVLPLPKEKS
jgi:hypothetical protein